MTIRYFAAAVAATICLVVAGCGAQQERNVAPQADTDALHADADTPQQDVAVYTSEWTAGIIDRPQPNAPVALLVAVRTGTHEGFDRIVFEFEERVPGYHIEYIDQPVRKCGSGNVTPVAGDGWLEVRMSPVNAHTEEGQPTVTERERMPNLTVLSELELTCDFEAIVTWVLGVESPNRYQVQELNSPPRLVVDVRH